MNRINSNDSEKYGLILIDRIDADCKFGLQNFCGLDRNETGWFGYKCRNDSKNFGLNWNEFHSCNANESDWLIRTFNPNESGQTQSIRINPVCPNQSQWFWKIRFHSDCKFGLIRNHWIHSDYKFGLILNRPRIDSDAKISSD